METFEQFQSRLSTLSYDRKNSVGLFGIFGACAPALSVLSAQRSLQFIQWISASLSSETFPEKNKMKVLKGCCYYAWHCRDGLVSSMMGDNFIEALKEKLEISCLQDVEPQEYRECLREFSHYLIYQSKQEVGAQDYPFVCYNNREVLAQIEQQIARHDSSAGSLPRQVSSTVGGVFQRLFS